MIEATDIAYIAGLIDGEAYIGIKRTTTRRNGRVNPQFQERIQMRMVDEPAIKFIADIFDVPYYHEPSKHPQRRSLYSMGTTDLVTVNILRTALPYLKIKRRVAGVVLSLRQLKEHPDKVAVVKTIKSRWGQEIQVKRWRHSDSHIAECTRLWQLCKDINKGRI